MHWSAAVLLEADQATPDGRAFIAAHLRNIAAAVDCIRVQWWRFDDTTKSLVAFVPGEMERPPECDPEGRIGEADQQRGRGETL